MRCKTLFAGFLLLAGTGFAAQANEAPLPDQLKDSAPAEASPAAPAPAGTDNDVALTGAPAASPSLAPPETLPEAVEIQAPASLLEPIDLTADHDDLWERIRTGFSMPNLESAAVRRQQAWYLSRPDYLQRVVERSRRYMHYIVEEIEKRGMPTELALLPIVESAYNPMALSSAKASGLWQFIPSTGRIYKLDQNWWVDERRDIIASTDAALDYLKYVYEMHGDWQLALASYNWGEGAVARAIAKNRAKGLPTDYASLKMPRETQHYVPKLQALKNIINTPGLWAKLDLEDIPNKPYFGTVPKPADMDVTLAAKFAEMPVAEFIALNPAHRRPVIRADIPLVLPTDKIDTFITNLEQHDESLISWQTYTFKKGDTLPKVAKRFGLSIAKLKSINGINGRRARVLPGQGLLVPARDQDAAALELASFRPPESLAPKPSRKGKRGAKVRYGKGKKAVAGTRKGSKKAVVAKRTHYTVKKGDTLWGIARRFNITTGDITRLNRVKNGIKAGQRLIIGAS